MLDWKNIPKDRCILPLELLSWINKAAVEFPPKKVKLDECQPLKDISNWFGSCVTDGETLTTFSKGFVPINTKQNTQWAIQTFEAWRAWRNGVYQDDRVPSGVLTSGDAVALNKWLSLLVIEVRKQDGNKYPSKTIYLLLAGLKRHMKVLPLLTFSTKRTIASKVCMEKGIPLLTSCVSKASGICQARWSHHPRRRGFAMG